MFVGMAAVALAALTSVDLAIEYKECVEQFGFNNVRSGDPAESLVVAGESECAAMLAKVREKVRQEVLSEPAVAEARRTIPRSDVENLVRSAIETRMQNIESQMHKAALRNVIVFKAKLNELEAN